MARKALSSVDTAWLRMEDPTNLIMITGVMVFGKPLAYDRLKAILEERLLVFDRFRQRVVQPVLPGARPYWEDDPNMDLRYHLQRATLPPPGDQAALQELASLLASTQLDFSRPLWQIHLVEGYGDEGSALICRLHHCIGDGLALVHVLLSLTETAPDARWPLRRPVRRQVQSRTPFDGLFRRTRKALGASQKVAGAALSEYLETWKRPSRVIDIARLGARGTEALARLLLLWPDPDTVFKGPLGVAKRAAWSDAIPLAEIKSIGRTLGGTVNDVLLTAMTGSLRRYLEGRGEPVGGLNFRAVVPVNLRPPGAEPELGNRFGLFFLSLPVGIVEPAQRLRELARRMDARKGSLEAPVAFGILNTIGMSPSQIQDVVVTMFGTKGTAVMTNVIGPREALYLAGAPLEGLMFWVPQSGRLGIGVSILSYAGSVWMGVMTDAGLVPDPEAIIAGFHAEFNELLGLTRQPQEPPTPQERCRGTTRSGLPCRNYPLAGSAYCRVHQGQSASGS
jgi:diacylglycerol O-acyltransferase / wax synthase